MLKTALLGLALVTPTICQADVIGVEITVRQPWAGNRPFGKVGAYEVIRGRIRYAIDPRSKAARAVVDLRRAPVNAHGLVEYSGPFVMIRPIDPALSNHTLLVEAANRGRTQMEGIFFESEDGLDLMSPENVKALSDTTVFQLGYSLAWVGWEGRAEQGEFGLKVPVADVHGSVRATFEGTEMAGGTAFDLPSSGFYCARDANQRRAVLRQQTRFDDRGTVVPRNAWRFAAPPEGSDPRCGVVLDQPAAADDHFVLVYDGENAPVMGLGEAAFRDFAVHVKQRKLASELNNRQDDAVLAFGYSQGGRFLRDFLYRGFNTDADGHRVFDGMLIATAGAGRGSFNHRYALPGEAGNSVMSNLRAVDLYPFADVPTPDINGEGNEGLLDRAVRDGTVPKIMYVNSSSEYWARAASLVQTTADGTRPVALGTDSRLYYFAGAPHALRRPESFRDKGREAAYPYNANVDLADGLSAQLENLRQWVSDDVAPPESIAPSLDGTLVRASHLNFPSIPGIRVPGNPPPVWRLDMGRSYVTKGVTREPVTIRERYPLLVPATDADGNELGGWRGAMSSVPLGTFTAWNWRLQERAPFGFISGLNGAFIPFARTRAERLSANDPRPSLEERYGDRTGFMKAVAASIDDAIAKRFLLPLQRDAILIKMGAAWDDVIKLNWHPGARANSVH